MSADQNLQPCADTGSCLKDQSGFMNDMDDGEWESRDSKQSEKFNDDDDDISYIYIYICVCVCVSAFAFISITVYSFLYIHIF